MKPEAHASVLLISDNAAIAQLVRESLAVGESRGFEVEWVRRLSEGLEHLGRKGIAAVLLELSLPDSQGMEGFEKLFFAASDIPILILAERANEAIAVEALEHGAQDYLLTSHLDDYTLSRALRNSIERKAIEDELYLERERAVVTLNSIGDAVLSTDLSGCVTYLNRVAEVMTGWGCKEALGRPIAEILHILDGTTRMIAPDPTTIAIQQDRTWGLTENCVLVRRDGTELAIEDSTAPIHDRSGRLLGAVLVFRDVSESRLVSKQIAYQAQHDLLTDLPNRKTVRDRITQAIALARRENRSLAVMFLDLDHFKYINDSLGHAIGDQLLQSVAKLLVASVRHSDTVSRQGGDEFVILLSEITHLEDAARSAEKLLAGLISAHSVGGYELHISGSIGISVFPGDGEDAESLVQHADLAMYHAKEEGRNKFQFFKPEMNLKVVKRQQVESGLHRALKENEFFLEYQPKVNLDTGEIIAAEALIRWQHPERGLVYPSDFVPIAEECGLIVQIGRWVLGEACRQIRAWQEAGLPALAVSVNVSVIEFRDKDFIRGVQEILAKNGVPTNQIELELTERVLMKNASRAAAVLQELKNMGILLALDDFGTGYSSLSYLRQFPFDVLKIDRSFVRQIGDGTGDSAIVSAIIAIGKSLNFLIVAEGIETQEQNSYLQAQGCVLGQGYLFSRPLPAEQFAELLLSSAPLRS